MTLGHLKGGHDNLREGERGYGADLSTQAYGAVRAGQGLLLSSEPGNTQLAATGALEPTAAGAATCSSASTTPPAPSRRAYRANRSPCRPRTA